MKNILQYKGYFTKIEYSVEDRLLYGKIEGIKDLVNFESESVEEIEQEPVYIAPKPVQVQHPRQQPVQKPVRQSQKQQYYVQEDVNREKYTSTMDIALRRQIKIACATRGIMFAKFVEDACREKLAREGVR